MKKIFYKGRFIFVPLAVAACLSVVSLIVMQLWNHLLPDILHASPITFWQAMGLFVLCKILFGFGKGGGAPWMRKRMAERMKHMTPEEREHFKAEMESRMCGWKRKHSERFDFSADKPSAGDTPIV